MAINSTYYDGQLQASYDMSSQGNESVQGELKAKSLISSISANSKYRRRKSKNSNKSIISNDTMHLRSLAEEDGNKKYQSSFRLAAKLYKSNSDELKLKKRVNKKSNKKSVLTLPNEPTVLPQSCTVSDMNDTEYLKSINKPKLQKTNKRVPNKRLLPPNLDYEYYDRDADYCSQMNVYLDCSSVDVVKNFKGDGKRKTRCAHSSKSRTETDESTPSDVWTVLRNINRFQFHSSPPMSDDSTFCAMPRKKKVLKKKINRGVYETCRTEQIAYFSNIEVKVPTVPRDCSPSGSSQITVIDNRNEFDISKEVEKTFDIYAPLMNAKNNSAKSPKSKVKCKRITNSTQATTSSKKKSVSKDTLIGLKSEVPLKSVETCNEHYDSFVESVRKENVCTEVEVQTESENVFEQKEEFDKFNMNTMNRATMNENLDWHRNAKAPLHRSLLSRSSVQSPERQLITIPNAAASIAGRPLTTAPSKTGASSVNRWLSMGPKTVVNSTGRPLMYVPPKTVARLTGSALSTITSPNNAHGPAGRTLSMVPSKVITSPPDRPIPITSYKTVADPVSLTFSKLQDSPRKSMKMVTQSGIRSIVAKLKFPLIILGKDQVSGTFEVEEYDYPQFKGLDEHVWPFMIDWVNKPREIEAATHCKNKMIDKTYTITGANPSQFNKKEQMRKANPEVKQSAVAKVKPTSRFRDNMLKLLYKKASHSHQNIVKETSPGRVQRDVRAVSPVQIRSNNTNTNKCKTVDTASSSISIVPPRIMTPPKTLRLISPSSPPPPTSPSEIMVAPKFRETKPIWGKAKRASDFIENIFKKIKNGTYYTSEIQSKNGKVPLQNRTCDTNDLKQIINDSKEVSIQVSIVPEDFIPKITIQKKKELFITLPGFDDAVPQLEIQSMTRNQIAVRHCITDILLQFDVNMPPEADRTLPFKRSTSFETLPVTESKTKVFKCKTNILNAVLPAELCSIIPKVLMQCLDREAPNTLILQEEKRKLPLSTISETILSEISERAKLPLLPQIEMLPELRRLRNGRFLKNPKSWTEKSSSNENFYIISVNDLPYQYGNREEPLLLRPIIALNYYYYIGQMLVPRHSTKPEPTPTPVPHIQNSSPVTNLCTALVPYTGNTMMFGECTNQIQTAPIVAFKELFKMILKSNISCMSEYFPTIQLRTSNNHVYVNSFIGHHQRLVPSGGGDCITLSINATTVKLQLLCNVSSNSFRAIENNGCTEKQIEYIKHARPNELNKTEKINPMSNGGKSKRKGHARYVKLYKKCKSTSHIAAERSSTPLSKVTNLDEFFQALGAGKMLSSAVDGRCGSKIMSSISNLKRYITGITPRQALLVMLLANKKDTSNLVRFRPMILQGIAVNRITRVSELDMEVEVIEKERFKMPEYLDKFPVSETIENNDNLLEELYWIAKTTAADHQRRFDASSEKLLKALLEKRKRLNPSYLRVMARYVGLGLLKTPVNH